MSVLVTAAVVVGSVAMYILVGLGVARLWYRREIRTWLSPDDIANEALVYGSIWPIAVIVFGAFQVPPVARRIVRYRIEPKGEA